MGRRESFARVVEYSGRELGRAEDVNRYKEAMEPLDSGNAISASLAAARLARHRPPCPPAPLHGPRACGALHRRAAAASRSPEPALRIPLAAGWALKPAHSTGRGEQPLRFCGRTAGPRQRRRFPAGRRCERRGGSGGRCCPSRPTESGARRGRGGGSPGSGIVFPGSGQLGGWRPGGGGAGRGRCGRKGKCRAPAPTQSQRTPPPRCGFAAATYGSVCKHAPRQQREKHKHSKF